MFIENIFYTLTWIQVYIYNIILDVKHSKGAGHLYLTS